MKTYSATRWWSKWEVMKQVLEYYLAPVTTGQLLDIFNDASDAKELELKLAALIDGYGGPYLQTQQTTLETQHSVFETQHKVFETLHKIVETQHKIIETQNCRKTTQNNRNTTQSCRNTTQNYRNTTQNYRNTTQNYRNKTKSGKPRYENMKTRRVSTMAVEMVMVCRDVSDVCK